MRAHIAKAAFSLVELAIVLVILGLLAGGVLSGTSLIRAAELRSVTSEHSRYNVAIQAFRDKYFGLPGDMKDAEKFWTTAAICAGSGATSPGTCNGDGDGIITPSAAAASVTAEAFQAWRQLALAGLIEGTYNGVSGTLSGTDYSQATVSPRSKVKNAGWMISYIDNTGAASGHMFRKDYRNWLAIGSTMKDKTYIDDSFLKAEEAWNIDSKMDDGKPGTGSVQGMGLDSDQLCTAAGDNTAFNDPYNLGTTNQACALLFKY